MPQRLAACAKSLSAAVFHASCWNLIKQTSCRYGGKLVCFVSVRLDSTISVINCNDHQ